MDATTVAVDLAKSRFELAVADAEGRIQRRARLSRTQLLQFLGNHPRSLVVMEACGSAHHWARTLVAQGHQVRLLPAQYVRAYVRRNKTDAADAGALLEALRCGEIRPVPVKSIEQQSIQQLHRLRSQGLTTRTARINRLRGALREFGVSIPVGARRGLCAVREALATESAVPALLVPAIEDTLAEIARLEQQCGASSASSHVSRARMRSHRPCWRSPASARSAPARCARPSSISSASAPAASSRAGSA